MSFLEDLKVSQEMRRLNGIPSSQIRMTHNKFEELIQSGQLTDLLIAAPLKNKDFTQLQRVNSALEIRGLPEIIIM